MHGLRATGFLAAALVFHIATIGAESAPAKPAGQKPPPPSAEIRGKVTGPATEKAPDGAPVPKAKVHILARDAESGERRRGEPPKPVTLETGADGTFVAKGLQGDSYTVRVQAPGLAPFDAPAVSAGATLTIRLKPGFTVEGRVLDAATREAASEVTVLARDRRASLFGEDAIPKATTGEDGRFRIGDLSSGVFDFEARAPRWARSVKTGVTVPKPKGAADSLEIYVRPGGRLAGRVTGPDGKALPDVRVQAQPASMDIMKMIRGGVSLSTQTDAQGRFEIDGVPAGGSFKILATKKGFGEAEAGPFGIEGGTVRNDVDLKLESGTALKVRLLDPDGEPVGGLELQLRGDRDPSRSFRFGGGSVDPDQIEKGEEGRFTVRGLTAGVYTVQMYPEGFADVERKDVRLRAGETADLGTITAREGRSVRGRVVDGAGEPVSGAEVRAFWIVDRSGKSREVKTGPGGTFRIPGVGDGAVQSLMVSAKGFARTHRENVAPGDEEVEIVLARSGSIVGRVVLAEGGVPSAAQVEAHPEAKRQDEMGMRFAMFMGDEEVLTDASGAFKVEGLEPGVFTIEAVSEGRAPAKKTGIRVESEGIADAGVLELKEGLRVRGRVLDARDDTPVVAASVRVDEPQMVPGRFMGNAALGHVAITEADGSFQVGGLEPKVYQVAVEHPDYSKGDARAALEEGRESAEVLVRLSRGGTLTGTVRNAQTQPVTGAMIMVMQGMGMGGMQTATTGADGTYRVERLAPGEYHGMRAPEDGPMMIGMGMKSFAIREGETTVLDFDEAAKVALSGRVLRGGRPVPSAVVVFMAGQGDLSHGGMPSEMKTGQADPEGRYHIGLDHGGPYTVMVQASGDFMGRSSVQVVVPEEPQAVLDITLSAGGIQGMVTGADGQPIVGAVIQVRPASAASTDYLAGSAGQSQAGGTYTIDGLTPGAYRVSAMASGFRPAEPQTVEIVPDAEPLRVDLRLEKGRSIRGRVVDPQGRGLTGALIFAAPAGSGEMAGGVSGSSDVNGAFEVVAPSDGPIDLTAIVGGWAPARITGVVAHLEPGSAAGGADAPEMVLRATAGGRIRVQVAGADGRPAVGIQVVARAVPPFLGSTVAGMMRQVPPTDASGATTLDLLAPGAYEVSVVGRQGVAPMPAQVAEGSEAGVTLILP